MCKAKCPECHSGTMKLVGQCGEAGTGEMVSTFRCRDCPAQLDVKGDPIGETDHEVIICPRCKGGLLYQAGGGWYGGVKEYRMRCPNCKEKFIHAEHQKWTAWPKGVKKGGLDIKAHRRHLQFFNYGHLPDELKKVSMKFNALAHSLVEDLPDNDQRDQALHRLLESKDAAVRALVYTEMPQISDAREERGEAGEE